MRSGAQTRQRLDQADGSQRFICSRKSRGPVTSSPRIWLMHWVFALIADRRATRRQRMDSTIPSRDFGTLSARPETTAWAAA